MSRKVFFTITLVTLLLVWIPNAQAQKRQSNKATQETKKKKEKVIKKPKFDVNRLNKDQLSAYQTLTGLSDSIRLAEDPIIRIRFFAWRATISGGLGEAQSAKQDLDAALATIFQLLDADFADKHTLANTAATVLNRISEMPELGFEVDSIRHRILAYPKMVDQEFQFVDPKSNPKRMGEIIQESLTAGRQDINLISMYQLLELKALAPDIADKILAETLKVAAPSISNLDMLAFYIFRDYKLVLTVVSGIPDPPRENANNALILELLTFVEKVLNAKIQNPSEKGRPLDVRTYLILDSMIKYFELYKPEKADTARSKLNPIWQSMSTVSRDLVDFNKSNPSVEQIIARGEKEPTERARDSWFWGASKAALESGDAKQALELAKLIKQEGPKTLSLNRIYDYLIKDALKDNNYGEALAQARRITGDKRRFFAVAEIAEAIKNDKILSLQVLNEAKTILAHMPKGSLEYLEAVLQMAKLSDVIDPPARILWLQEAFRAINNQPSLNRWAERITTSGHIAMTSIQGLVSLDAYMLQIRAFASKDFQEISLLVSEIDPGKREARTMILLAICEAVLGTVK